jgi:tyrosine-specific transport protein
LVAVGIPSVNISNLLNTDSSAVLKTIPIMFVALVFHNIVPVICGQLNYQREKIRMAIVGGSFLPLLMFLTWNAVILGIGSPSGVTFHINYDFTSPLMFIYMYIYLD